MATNKYELYRNGDFGSVTKTVTKTEGDNLTTLEIEVAHIKGSDYVSVRIAIHKWVGWEDTHAFLRFSNVRDGWDAFRQLCTVLGVMA